MSPESSSADTRAHGTREGVGQNSRQVTPRRLSGGSGKQTGPPEKRPSTPRMAHWNGGGPGADESRPEGHPGWDAGRSGISGSLDTGLRGGGIPGASFCVTALDLKGAPVSFPNTFSWVPTMAQTTCFVFKATHRSYGGGRGRLAPILGSRSFPGLGTERIGNGAEVPPRRTSKEDLNSSQ